MSSPLRTPATLASSESKQLESSGGASLTPPAFSLDAAPIQRQEADGGSCMPEEEQVCSMDAVSSESEGQQCSLDDQTELAPELQVCEGPTTTVSAPPPTINTADAISFNNGMEFRIDWVRNLQLSLLGRRVSTDGSFDIDTVNAVATFQRDHMTGQTVNGKIDANTRRQLEISYPILFNTVTGTHLQPRVLVPGDATDAEKYGYWRGVIENAGGVFLADVMAMNLIGIRGVLVADGSDAHQIGGVTLAAGTVYQSGSAQAFVDARAAGTTHRHTSGNHEGFDDMIVSVWIDAAGVQHVQQRIGNVDPGDLYTDDSYGTGHLTDGQYAYGVGTHGTSSRSHMAAVRGIDDPDGLLNLQDNGTNIRYRALRPTRNQEVWREHEDNDRFVSANEEETSRERIYNRNGRYVNDNFAMNIHSSRDSRPNSQACMNVPASQYIEFLREINASSNQSNVLYTLIDASKVENGLTVVRSGRP